MWIKFKELVNLVVEDISRKFTTSDFFQFDMGSRP